MHPSSYEKMKSFVEKLPKTPLLIADVGSFNVNGTFRPLFERPDWKYVGMDIRSGPNVDLVLASTESYSNIPSNTYDVVISGSTLEHVERPWKFIPELVRILKPSGTLCVIAPYEWEFHQEPIDCWRIYPHGMSVLFKDAGLMILNTYMGDKDTVGIGRKI